MIPQHAQVLLVDNSAESSIPDNDYNENLSQLVQRCKAFRMEGDEDHSFFEPEILEEYGSLPLETYKWNQLGRFCSVQIQKSIIINNVVKKDGFFSQL